jgi:hypothetical protein
MWERGPIWQEIHQVLGVFVEAELSLIGRNVAGVVPVGDVDVVVLQQGFHGAAQQRGEVAGHRRHQQ